VSAAETRRGAGLVLSLFPGIGLLDMAFEAEGFCVVRGPDVLWGGDVREFHPPAGRFDGVIGGPPCKAFSPLVNINIAQGREPAKNLIPEYERCVAAIRPRWFLMENVKRAPMPNVLGYVVRDTILNNRWVGGAQNRLRRFSFGTPDGLVLHPQTEALEPVDFEPAVTSTSGGRRAVLVKDADGRPRGNQGDADWHRLRRRSVSQMAVLQGLPADFLEDSPLTDAGKRLAIGNGVPLPMGRAMAQAVKRALEHREAA
jgi:DNA (cytosine-5)-methyltransferase 1